MTARTLPTLPTFTMGQELTSSLMNELVAYMQFWANPPMFRMYQATAQPSVANAADTQITCDTSTWDSDSGRSTSTPFSYVIPFAGRWTFTGAVIWAGNVTGSRQSKIFKNGALIPDGSYTAMQTGPAATNSGIVVTVTTACNVGDVIGLYGYQSSGGTLATSVVTGLPSYFEGKLASLASP